MRFREKGGKIITKPIPEEFAEPLRMAISVGDRGSPDSYVIPMARGQRREGDPRRPDRERPRGVRDAGPAAADLILRRRPAFREARAGLEPAYEALQASA